METLKVTLVLVLLVSKVCCGDTREESSVQKWLRSAEVRDVVQRMIRRPGPRPSVGLMGGGSGVKANARKRHRYQSFVGLMGRRSFDGQEPPYNHQD